MDKEIRSGKFEIRAEEDGTINVEGYAAVFDQETEIGGQFNEMIERGAFKNAIGGGFVKYGEIVTKLEALEGAGGTDHSAEIAVLEEKVNALETADTSHTHEVGEHKHEEHGHTKILINEKQIELIKNQIQELKERSDNPLAG